MGKREQLRIVNSRPAGRDYVVKRVVDAGFGRVFGPVIVQLGELGVCEGGVPGCALASGYRWWSDSRFIHLSRA